MNDTTLVYGMDSTRGGLLIEAQNYVAVSSFNLPLLVDSVR